MRLIQKDVDVTHARIHIKAQWVDNFRRAGTVHIHVAKNVSDTAASTLIDGEPSDVTRTLAGIAEIAWRMGWRPEGLDAVLLHAVRTHGGKSPL